MSASILNSIYFKIVFDDWSTGSLRSNEFSSDFVKWSNSYYIGKGISLTLWVIALYRFHSINKIRQQWLKIESFEHSNFLINDKCNSFFSHLQCFLFLQFYSSGTFYYCHSIAVYKTYCFDHINRMK